MEWNNKENQETGGKTLSKNLIFILAFTVWGKRWARWFKFLPRTSTIWGKSWARLYFFFYPRTFTVGGKRWARLLLFFYPRTFTIWGYCCNTVRLSVLNVFCHASSSYTSISWIFIILPIGGWEGIRNAVFVCVYIYTSMCTQRNARTKPMFKSGFIARFSSVSSKEFFG